MKEKFDQLKIESERFMLRQLEVSDVTDRYASWFEDSDTKKFILSSENSNSKEKLISYVSAKRQKSDVLFLGIFSKAGQHIGNIKFEPINWEAGYAVMGILIGEVDWRGKGVSGEVLLACADFFRQNKFKEIVLGVGIDNIPAIRSYEKIGFIKSPGKIIKFKEVDQAIEMILTL